MRKIAIHRFILFALLASIFSVTHSQVTIGDASKPQPFSILEISAREIKGGLRLPQINETERDEIRTNVNTISNSTEKAKAEDAMKGLTIYNVKNNCIEFWNGSSWVSLCDDNTSGGGSGSSTCANILTVSPDDNTPIAPWQEYSRVLGPVSATFDSGSPVHTFQWYKGTSPTVNSGGTLIPGETNSTITVTRPMSSGIPTYYYCVVTTTCSEPSSMASGVWTVTFFW